MKVVLFGATGMIGQGVLRACLSSSEVEGILLVARSSSGVNDPKVHELIHQDMAQYLGCEDTFKGYDACFFCLGVSSVGMQANEYERITYGFTTAAASALAQVDPGMTFIYISGAGTDSSERGRSRWARVKGKTENAVLAMPFKAAYMLRPGLIVPSHGVRSKTAWYRIVYALTRPLVSLLHRLFPNWVLTTEEIGKLMLRLVSVSFPKQVLEVRDMRTILNDPSTMET